MYLWVSADIERLQNHFGKATLLYDEALEAAQKNGFIPFIGLICESAAQHYIDLNIFTSAEAYIKRAHFSYQRWCATYKCKLLTQKYKQFFAHSTGQSASAHMQLDISTIMKSSQAISSEVELKKTVNTLLKLS